MQTNATAATTFASLADLLVYPTDTYKQSLSRLSPAACPGAAAEIAAFAESVARMPLSSLEEIFTRTFDMAPICVPYVTTHIWGDESFERGKLMSGLAEAYRRLGLETGGELPDHLALLLKFTTFLDESELKDLVTYCLRGPVKEMTARLESADNLYAPVLRAISMVIERDFPEDKSHD